MPSESAASSHQAPNNPAAAPPRRIAILDTTLRDGEQSAGVCFSARDKTEIAARLDALGVDVIEAGFPVSSPEEAAAVAAVALEVRGASVCALARAPCRATSPPPVRRCGTRAHRASTCS